jgi:DNA topoisomerase-1
MSTDSAMLSDDDRPLAARSIPNGKNHTNGIKTNGHVKEEEDYEMSDVDDRPLVSHSHFSGTQLGIDIVCLLTSQASRKPGKASPSRKRKKPIIDDPSSSDDDVPLASSPAKPTNSKKQNGKSASGAVDKKPPKKKVKQKGDAPAPSPDEDAKPSVAKKAPRKPRKSKAESPLGDSSEDDKPIASKAETKARAKAIKEEQSGSEAPKAKKRAKVKEEEPTSLVKGKGKKKDEEEEEDVFRWWAQDPNGDGTAKWTALEHWGVIFPPPYELLPSVVKMKYNGVSSYHITIYLISTSSLRKTCRPPSRSRGSCRLLWSDA